MIDGQPTTLGSQIVARSEQFTEQEKRELISGEDLVEIRAKDLNDLVLSVRRLQDCMLNVVSMYDAFGTTAQKNSVHFWNMEVQIEQSMNALTNFARKLLDRSRTGSD